MNFLLLNGILDIFSSVKIPNSSVGLNSETVHKYLPFF